MTAAALSPDVDTRALDAKYKLLDRIVGEAVDDRHKAGQVFTESWLRGYWQVVERIHPELVGLRTVFTARVLDRYEGGAS